MTRTIIFTATAAILAMMSSKVEGFHVTPHRHVAPLPTAATRASFTRLASTPDEEPTATATPDIEDVAKDATVVAVVTTAPLAAAAAAVATASTADRIAATMDERIYNFNTIVIDSVYDIICLIYPVTGGPRDFARFYVLETVARVPYFAYLSVMHLRETFGERGLGEKMRTHYAEADNELHHLLIMEELGGNDNAIDRAVAQTMAFGYYWYVVAVYAWSQECAYHLSELIENHAYNTYNTYLTEHEDMLKGMPVPAIATKYYVDDNPFLFDLFCTVKDRDEDGNFSARRPQLDSLYDVFVNVRDDEKEHWKTLCNLVQFGDMQGVENSLVKGTEPAPADQLV
jgi:ubiquinol oxidase